MRHYATIKEARNALALDTGFDPFESGHVKGRPTIAKLAELGYVVDPQAAEREERESEAIRAAQQQRSEESARYAKEWAERPSSQKYAAAAEIIGCGSSSMVEIGDDLAHVRNDRGVAIVERVAGGWAARLPNPGERIYV